MEIKKQYKIAVIVPLYNTEKYLRKCIESLMIQSFTDLLIILVDDGSTDGSGSICEEFENKYKNIIHLRKNNEGQGVARNYALDYLFSNYYFEYIAFIDSDDWIEPNYFKVLYDNIGSSDICMCGYYREKDTSGIVNCFASDRSVTLSPFEFWRVNNSESVKVVLWNKLYKSDLFRDIRFPSIRYCEDAFVIHRVIGKAKAITLIPDVLYHYIVRADSTMGQLDKNNKNVIAVQLNGKYEKCEYFLNEGDFELFIFHYDRYIELLQKYSIDNRESNKYFVYAKKRFYDRKRYKKSGSFRIWIFLHFKHLYTLIKRLFRKDK